MGIKTLKLTNDYDIDLTGNQINFIEGDDAVIQNLKSCLLIKKGEWFLNTTVGMERENMIGKGFDLETVKSDVYEAISQEENVKSVDDLTITRDGHSRLIKVYFKVTLKSESTIEGEVIV